MADTIYTFVKLFERREWAESFMRGRLFMNTVRHFREYKDTYGELRGDPHEGAVAAYHPHTITSLKFGDVDIPAADLAGPIVVHANRLQDWNVLCLYSMNNRGYPETFSADALRDMKPAFQIHEHCFGLGRHAVFFRDPKTFLERLAAKLNDMKVPFRMGLVDYYDEQQSFSRVEPVDAIFRKRKRFELQREYRIAAEFDQVPGPFVLDVGDLSDIAEFAEPEEFNRQVTLSLPDGTTA